MFWPYFDHVLDHILDHIFTIFMNSKVKQGSSYVSTWHFSIELWFFGKVRKSSSCSDWLLGQLIGLKRFWPKAFHPVYASSQSLASLLWTRECASVSVSRQVSWSKPSAGCQLLIEAAPMQLRNPTESYDLTYVSSHFSIKAKPALQQDSLDKTRKGDVIIFCFHFVQKNKTLQHISLIWNGIFPNCASLLNFLTSLCSSILEATSASGCWVLMGSRVKKHLYSTWYRSVFRRLTPFNVLVM